MPTSPRPTPEEIRSTVRLAVRAPSIHNSQPWLWSFDEDVLELRADRSRALPAIDPDGRSLLISCGAALSMACLTLLADGWELRVDRVPVDADPDLLARVHVVGRGRPDGRLRDRVTAAADRHSERRPFRPVQVSRELLDQLVRVVAADGVYADVLDRADEQLDLAVVVSWADELEAKDEAYRDELGRWVRADAAADGVPASAVPHVPAGSPRHTDVPLRNFEAAVPGGLPAGEPVDEHPTWLLVFTESDDAVARLRAGEAYARLLVEVAHLGLASSAATQALDLPAVRARARALMDWPDHPQMLVRVGWPPEGDSSPPSPRRPLRQVLTIRPDDRPPGEE